MTPRVTVLLPVYNGLPWVRESIASVLAQTLTDFELLVVDDCGTDGSIEAVLAFADARIHVLRNDRNLGQVESLNRGLREARGAYIARLDQDDLMLPTRLQQQVDVLDRNPDVALVGTWMNVVDETGRLWAPLRGRVRSFPEFVLAVLVNQFPWGHPSLALRRDAVLAVGGYDVTQAPAEDKDLYRRLVLARCDARCVEEPLVNYRRHGGQASQTREEKQKRVDREGHETFLTELCGASDAPGLHLLLTGDPRVWTQEIDLRAAVDRLLLGATQRLRLDADETQELERLLAARVAAAACGAWRAGAAPAWRRSPAVFAHAAIRGGARFGPTYVTTLLGGPLAAPALRAVRHLARKPQLAAARELLRRSRILRRLYAWLPES